MNRLLLTIFLLLAYLPSHSETAQNQPTESSPIASPANTETRAKDSANPKPIVGALTQTLMRSGDIDSPLRQKIGIGALVFLFIWLILFHQLKREIWKDIETN